MKKLIEFLLFAFLFLGSQIALPLNFYGVQSLNGLNGLQVFTAPTNGYYFVNGQLNLSSLSSTGGQLASGAFVVISKNGTAYHLPSSLSPTLLYTGLGGATGFQLNQISLTTGDTINVQLFSTVSGSGIQGGGDASFNAVTGQIYYGNTF